MIFLTGATDFVGSALLSRIVVDGVEKVVGQRPLLMEYLPLYSAVQARRHETRPGITGWAQVDARNA